MSTYFIHYFFDNRIFVKIAPDLKKKNEEEPTTLLA